MGAGGPDGVLFKCQRGAESGHARQLFAHRRVLISLTWFIASKFLKFAITSAFANFGASDKIVAMSYIEIDPCITRVGAETCPEPVYLLGRRRMQGGLCFQRCGRVLSDLD
jgi:hypothetical protein